MKLKKSIIVPLMVVTLLITALCVAGPGDEKAEKKMSPEEQVMMAKWVEFITPGKEHTHLARMVGSWNVATKMWMQPGAPLQEGKATAECEMIMGGRYLVMKFKSVVEGMPFEGMNISGFDNFNKVYRSFWIDNMGTSFYLTEGTCDESFKTCSDKGTWDDPMTGSQMNVRSTSTWQDDNTFLVVMFQTPAGGKEFKSMEFAYTRK